jgi:Ca-activated chloride channel family protein
MQKAYHNAKIYYTKTLQLGVDEDASHNLELVVLLADKKDAQLGIAHPKSQDAGSSKSESQDKEESRNEDKPSNGSGASGESTSPKEKAEEKNKLLDDEDEEKYPLSSKVYELINKGYIHETRPW